MKKGTFLIAKSGNQIYQVVGRWDKDIVLMPTQGNDEQVLIYGAVELENLIAEGRFRRLYDTGITK